MSYQLAKSYLNHYGVDYKNNDLTRNERFASFMKNAQMRQTGSIEKRKGYQGHGTTKGGYGLFKYQRANPTTGVDESEALTVDDNLWRILESTITVSYAGSEPNCQFSFFYDETTSQYRAQIEEGTTQVLDFACGIGIDEASPIQIGALSTAINALTNFTAVVTGSTTTPAAFLKIVRAWDLSTGTGESLMLPAKYYEQVYSPTTNPLSSFLALKNSDDFENASSINIQNCIYIATGQVDLMKYDGQTFYKAGLPTPASISTALAAGAVTSNNLYYYAQYIQHDAAGNVIEGNLFKTSSGISPAGQSVNVTVANVLAATGYNTNCALANGAQVGVTTITVDDGSGGTHTLQVGDTAYFFDSISAAYVEREITARTGTTITVAGAAVTVADNIVISNNLRIAIWRSKTSGVSAGGSSFYLVAEIPNNSFSSTQLLNDNKADSALGDLLIPPATDRSAPPKAKYASSWNGIMMLSGDPENRNYVYASDIDGCEYFPATGERTFSVEWPSGDSVSGIGPSNEVFGVFGNNSFSVLVGDIQSGIIKVEHRSFDTGCIAHATITDVDGLLCWLSQRGPRYSASGQVPRPLGEAQTADGQPTGASRIDPIFDNTGRIASETFILKRAVGFSDNVNNRYLIYVPCESTEGGNNYANTNSRVFAFDNTRNAWLDWRNLNMAGGIIQFGDEVYFQERRYSVFNSAVNFVLYRRHNLEDPWDYADNTEAIEWDYSPQWDTQGEPSVLKKYTKIRLFNLDDITNNDYSVTVEQEVNYQADAASATFSVDFGGIGYGLSEYGVASYGDSVEQARFHDLARIKVRSTRFRFKNEDLHQNVILTGWELEVAPVYRPEFKK